MKIIKNLHIIIYCIILISCQKQTGYNIIGKLQGIPDSTLIDLYVQYENVGSRIATDTIFNGEFSFSDSIGSEKSEMILMLRDRQHYFGSCNLWVGKSNIIVSGKGKYLSQWTVSSNIQEQKAQNLLLKQTRDLRIAIDSLGQIRSLSQANSIKIQNDLDSINKIILNRELAYIKDNYNSLPAIIELCRIAQSADSQQLKKINEIVPKIDSLYLKTLYGEGIKNSLSKVSPPKIGDRYTDFYTYDLSGQPHRISEYAGRYLLLDFWSMACYPCILAAPEIREISDKFKNEINVIGVNLDTRKNLWEEATKRDSITWINLSDGKGVFGGAYHIYGINGFPTYLLIDPQGIIVERWMGYKSGIFKEKLSKYFIK